MNQDLISRQAAIDTLDVGAECLRRVLDETDIVGTEREKYKWGLRLFEACISDMKELPSAQPEIIRCKDCRHNHNCDIQYHAQAGDMFFCAGAERRTE